MNSTAEDTQNYFVGTNSSPRFVAEALRQGIISADECLLGIFDGIFYDSDNKRVGGIALNDFLVITDRAAILWARDQQRDYVDRFPLSHTFVSGHSKKEAAYAVLKISLVLPDVPAEEVAGADRLNITFDMVPLADIELLAGLLEVVSSTHRDLIKGKASEEDRAKATRIIFSQVFLARFLGSEETAKPRNHPVQAETHSYTYDPAYDSLAETIDDEEAEAFMTPLSRLDQLDTFQRRSSAPRSRDSIAPAYSVRSEQPATPRSPSRAYSDMLEETPSRFYRVEPDHNQIYYSSSSSGQATAIEQELRWMSQAQPQTSRAARRNSQATSTAPTTGPGTRLREELNNSEAFYVLNRARRAMADNLEKLRRDAEAKSMEVVPFLNSLRDSGMNVRDLTEFLVAANDLLDTVGKNPAARELAMMFANRAMNDAGKLKGNGQAAQNKPGRGPVEVENVEAKDAAPAPPRQGARVKVERRNKPQSVMETGETAAPSEEKDDFVADVGASQTTLPDIESEVVAPVSSQTSSGEPEMETWARAKVETRTEVEADLEAIPARPARHRLAIRGSNSTVNSTAGAADGGGLEGESVNLETDLKFSAPRGPDLN